MCYLCRIEAIDSIKKTALFSGEIRVEKRALCSWRRYEEFNVRTTDDEKNKEQKNFT